MVEPQVIPDDLRDWYDALYARLAPGEYSERIMYGRPHQDTRFDAVLEVAALVASRFVCLEVGCAEGKMTERLATMFSYVEAIDISRIAISRAPRLPNVTYQVGDIENWRFHGQHYDLIVISEVLEHLREPEKVLAELGQRATFVLASVPTNEDANERTFNLDLLGNEQRAGDAAGHIHATRRQTLMNWLAQAGMVVVEEREVSPSTIVLAQWRPRGDGVSYGDDGG